MAKKLTDEERMWRINYLYREAYGQIPLRPQSNSDNSIIEKIYQLWNVGWPNMLGKVVKEEDIKAAAIDRELSVDVFGKVVIEDFLDAKTGLFTLKKQRWLCKYDKPIKIQINQYWYYDKDELDSFIYFDETDKKNELNFSEWAYMRTFDRSLDTCFRNIKEIIMRTILYEPPSLKALPHKNFMESQEEADRWLNKCPSFMDSYKHELIKLRPQN